MRKNTILYNAYIMMLTLGLFPIVSTDCVFAKPNTVNAWKIREDLAYKLSTEWEKMDLVSRNLASLEDVISEMKDLEMYPVELTNLQESSLLKYDKRIESLGQQCKVLHEKVSLLKAPLIDALEILREMVTSEPVSSMFTVLEKGGLKRVNQLLQIRNEIDSLWKTSDSLIITIMNEAGMSFEPNKYVELFDEEFLMLMQTELGSQSQEYYKKLDAMKIYFKNKANSEQVGELYRIEKYRLQKHIDLNRYCLAKRKIICMQNRYREKEISDELNRFLARVEFSAKNYKRVLSVVDLTPQMGSNWDLMLLLKIQSLYALKEYQAIWKNYRNYDMTRLSGLRRNLFIWILMESGIALRVDDDYAQLASLIDNRYSYTHHVLHALSRTYLLSGDRKTAHSILESALKYKVSGENDRIALKEIKVALAQMHYEMSEYEESLALFYEILNEHENFERALIGIVWCYIKLGNDSKAETALRKLTNLMPESPSAAEAILILAEKTLLRADSEWKKEVYIEKEEKRLSSKLEYVIEKQKGNTHKEDKPKYEYAYHELKSLLKRLREENRIGHDSIRTLYNKIDKICSLINTHYKTGTFQEISFSPKREYILFYLDSTINVIKNSDSKGNVSELISNASQDRIKIKNLVVEAKVFSAIGAIDKYRWEREFLDWKKTNLRNRELELDSSMLITIDSLSVNRIDKARSEVKKTLDSIIIAEDEMLNNYTVALKLKIDSLLRIDIDSSDAAYLYYQYGELCYAEENIRYTALYERYEIELNNYYKQLNDFRSGVRLDHPVEPEAPRLNHDMSIENFRKVISDYSESQYVPSAHYSIAWCFNDMSIYDSALFHMEIMARNFPGSSYAAQAWMYSGEYHFERGKLGVALKSYQAVLKYPESEWFEEALYKLAWSQYRLSNPEKAISSFLALVDLGDGTLAGATLLEKESMDYIAISFSESDITGERGLERAMIFAEKLNDDAKGCRILHRLASVYREQGRYEIAKKTFRNLLEVYPKYSKSAIVESEMVKLLEREPSQNDINKIKVGVFEKYNRNSAWASTQSESVRKEADSIANKQLYDAAIGYHQYALQKNDTVVYENALKAYRDFISSYPASPLANECHYNLAEIQFAIGNYYEAAEEYIAVTKRYPDSKFRETAAWNAIVASQNLLKQENSLK